MVVMRGRFAQMDPPWMPENVSAEINAIPMGIVSSVKFARTVTVSEAESAREIGCVRQGSIVSLPQDAAVSVEMPPIVMTITPAPKILARMEAVPTGYLMEPHALMAMCVRIVMLVMVREGVSDSRRFVPRGYRAVLKPEFVIL